MVTQSKKRILLEGLLGKHSCKTLNISREKKHFQVHEILMNEMTCIVELESKQLEMGFNDTRHLNLLKTAESRLSLCEISEARFAELGQGILVADEFIYRHRYKVSHQS